MPEKCEDNKGIQEMIKRKKKSEQETKWKRSGKGVRILGMGGAKERF